MEFQAIFSISAKVGLALHDMQQRDGGCGQPSQDHVGT